MNHLSFYVPCQFFAGWVLGLHFAESRTDPSTASLRVVRIGVPLCRDEKYLQLETGVFWEA